MSAALSQAESAAEQGRLRVQDGWRGISILLLLARHLLPLVPNGWQLNETSGPMGMALFSTLSGFLITRFLLTQDSIPDFLIRRCFRIVPLAWLALALALPLSGTAVADYLPNFLFYANLPTQHLTDIASHFWSLCVEIQFYVGIAIVVAVLGRRGLYLLPIVCVAVTLNRVAGGALVAIVTWRRADEILAGGALALIHAGQFGDRPRRLVAGLNAYVIHHLLMFTWLGEGDKWVKYLKRPLLFALTFALAHVSTFYYEQRWIEFGKRLSDRLAKRRTARAES